MDMEVLVQEGSARSQELAQGIARNLSALDALEAQVLTMQAEMEAAAAEADKSLDDAGRDLSAAETELEKQVALLTAQLDELDKKTLDLHKRSADEMQRLSKATDDVRQQSVQARDEVVQQAKGHASDVDALLARMAVMLGELEGASRQTSQQGDGLHTQVGQHAQSVGQQVGHLATRHEDFGRRLGQSHDAFQGAIRQARGSVEDGAAEFGRQAVSHASTAAQGIDSSLGTAGSLADISRQAEQLVALVEDAARIVRRSKEFATENLEGPINRIDEALTRIQPILAVLQVLRQLGLV